MFVAPLKNNFQASIIILIVFSIGLWTCSFMFPTSHSIPSISGEHVFYHLLFSNEPSFVASQFMTFFSIIIGAFFINFIAINQEITSKTNYLPAFLYILFAFSATTSRHIEPILIANLFVLPAIYFIASAYRQDAGLSSIFKAGFLLGISSFFYSYYMLLFPIAMIALLILRSFNWREWVILIIGLMLPIYIYMCISYLNGFGAFTILLIFKNNMANFQKPILSEYYLVFIIITIFILILSIFHYASKGFGNKIKTVKIKYVILWLLFLSLIIVFYRQTTDLILLPCIIPLSIIMGDYLSEIKQLKIANTLLFLFLCGFVIIYSHALGAF
jgi:hypothetical protein